VAKEDAQATFAIDLENNVSGPAESAAQAIDNLRDSIERDSKALKALEADMKRLKGGTSTNIQQFRTLKAQIDAKRQSIAQAQGALVDLGATLERTRKPGSGFSAMLEQMQRNAQGVGGPLGTVSGRLASMKSLLAGGAIAIGVVAIAAGLALLVGAAVAASAALLKYGLAQANARRAELLRLEGLTKLRNWWGLAAGNAKEMQLAIDRVTGSVALEREEISGLATDLYRAGLRGQNLEDALEAVAIKTATQGQAAAKQWADLATGIALSGGSVRKFAQDVKSRLGGIAAAQMLDLNVQAKKLRENLGLIFADLKIEGVLKGLKGVTDLFSQSTITGRALKTIAQVALAPMIAALEFLAPLAKRFFQGMVLGVQAIQIGLLKAAIWAKRTFGEAFPKNLDLSNAALNAGLAVVSLLAAGFGVLAVAVGMLMVPLAGVAGAFAGLFWAAGKAYDFVAGIDWSGLGRSICDGIVNGVQAGATWVWDALKELGTTAWQSFKDALGIASPSKEFAKLGRALPQGVEAGVAAETHSLERTVSQMVEVPAPASPAARADGAASSGKAPIHVSIGEVVIQTSEATSRGIAADFRQQLEEVLSGLVVQTGARAA
jgi:hypothetical protein